MRRDHLAMDLFAVRLQDPNAGKAFVAKRADAALDFGSLVCGHVRLHRVLLVLFFRRIASRIVQVVVDGLLFVATLLLLLLFGLASTALLLMAFVELHDQLEPVAAQQVLEHARGAARREIQFVVVVGVVVDGEGRRFGRLGHQRLAGPVVEPANSVVVLLDQLLLLLLLENLLRRQAVKLAEGQRQLLLLLFRAVVDGDRTGLAALRWRFRRLDVGSWLFDQRPRQVDLSGSCQFLQFGGSGLMEDGPEVNVQRRSLAVGHFANVALPRLPAGLRGLVGSSCS